MASPARILAASIVRQDPLVLEAFLKTLAWQHVPKGHVVEHVIVDDSQSEEESKTLAALVHATLPEAEVVRALDRPAEALYTVAADTHHWNEAAFYHLGRQKQKVMQIAQERAYSAVWFVDSDLLLDQRTLVSLVACDVPVVSGVFWTHWQAAAREQHAPLPQCWLAHPYEQSGLRHSQEEWHDALADRELVWCAGGGACALIRSNALGAGRYSPPLPQLPKTSMWQGEDRTFAVTLQHAHVRQYADGWPDIYHAYHPSQRTSEALETALGALGADKQTRAGYGDLVSFRLTPLNVPGLVDRLEPEARAIRGRLGQLRLHPKLEHELLDMEPGTERLLKLDMPAHWPNKTVAGKTVGVRLELLDAKPWGYAPVLADYMFRGIA